MSTLIMVGGTPQLKQIIMYTIYFTYYIIGIERIY